MESFLRLWDTDGGMVDVDVAEESRIDAAVTAYLDSGQTRDTLLHLVRVDGDAYTVRVSTLASWAVSTPYGRRRSVEIEKEGKDEHDANRQAVGLWEAE